MTPTATWTERLRACWRILKGKPRTAWKRVEWTTGPLPGSPGSYTMSVWLGVSDLGAVTADRQEIQPYGVGAMAEHTPSHPYIPTTSEALDD